MAMITSTSACNTNYLSQNLSLESRNNLRAASFSSYLNSAEENFVLKLTESAQSTNSLIPTPHDQIFVGRKKVEDGEIGVFGAEKYFKGEVEEENRRILDKGSKKYQQEKDEEFNMYPVKQRNQSSSPSVRSESSWNSRSGLLPSNPKDQTRRKIDKVNHAKSFLASLGCSCKDKNSVEIDEQTGENRAHHGEEITKLPMRTGDFDQKIWAEEEIHGSLNREDCFTFPVLNSKEGNLAVQLQGVGEDTGRNSLDVFGSPIMEKEKHPLSLGKRLNMLTNWDVVIPREEEIRFPDDDTESDASSDLFEIESFSTNGNSFLARQASDGMSSSCFTPTTCYAPSEASVEWSVATASAADFSVAEKIVMNAKIGKTGKAKQKRCPAILLGCKSLKAVRVAGDEYRRTGEKAIASPRGRHQLDSTMPVSRFQAENKLNGLDSRRGHHSFDTCSLSMSHSPHASHLLYI